MCLAIPGLVVELVDGTNGQLALVDVLGARRHINIGLLEDDQVVAPGDWIIIHMGFALSRVDANEAARALGGLQMMGADDGPATDETEPAPAQPLAVPVAPG